MSSPDERRDAAGRVQSRARAARRGRSAPLPTVPTSVAELSNDALVDGRYRILRRASRWAVGSAFPAVDTTTDKPMVVVLPAIGPEEAVGFLARARVEVERTRPLHESHIVTLRDCGVLYEGLPYFVLRRVAGTSLLRYVRGRGAIGTDLALHLTERLLNLLRLGHERGLVLGDVRPANIILTEAGARGIEPDIVDLGFARGVFSGLLSLPKPPAAYRSPQAQNGMPLSPSDDVYAVGAVLYFMLTGKSPRQAVAASSRARPDRLIAPPSFVRPDLDLSIYVDKVVLQSLSTDREGRFGSVEDFLLAIRGLRELFSLSSAARAVLRLPSEDSEAHVDAFESDPTAEFEPRKTLPNLAQSTTSGSPRLDRAPWSTREPSPPERAGVGSLDDPGWEPTSEPIEAAGRGSWTENQPTREFPATKLRVEPETVPVDLEPLARTTVPSEPPETADFDDDSATRVDPPTIERPPPRGDLAQFDDGIPGRVVRLPSGRLPRVKSPAEVGVPVGARDLLSGRDSLSGRLPRGVVAVTDTEVLMEPLVLDREPAPLVSPSTEPSRPARSRRGLLVPLALVLLLVAGLALVLWVATHGDALGPERSSRATLGAPPPAAPPLAPGPAVAEPPVREAAAPGSPPTAAEAAPVAERPSTAEAAPTEAARPAPPPVEPIAAAEPPTPAADAPGRPVVRLQINTEPPGARVIRHKSSHLLCPTTPCTVNYPQLEPDSYIRLRFELAGHLRAITLIPVDRSGEHTVTLSPHRPGAAATPAPTPAAPPHVAEEDAPESAVEDPAKPAPAPELAPEPAPELAPEPASELEPGPAAESKPEPETRPEPEYAPPLVDPF